MKSSVQVALVMTLCIAAVAAKYDPAAVEKKMAALSKFTVTDTGPVDSETCKGITGFFGGSSRTCHTPMINAKNDEIKISGVFSGDVQVGFCSHWSTYREGTQNCYMIDLNDCCEENTRNPGRGKSCLPSKECPILDFQLHLNETRVAMESRAGNGHYLLFDDIRTMRKVFPKNTPMYFVVKATGRGYVTNLKVTSNGAAHVREHLAKGALIAEVGTGKCPEDFAACGDECWGVCPNNPVTSNSYCMCYPKGYTGVSGTFHAGASCLKSCGVGVSAESARSAPEAHQAFAAGEQQGSTSMSNLMTEGLAALKAIDDALVHFEDLDDDGRDDLTLEKLMDATNLMLRKAELLHALKFIADMEELGAEESLIRDAAHLDEL